MLSDFIRLRNHVEMEEKMIYTDDPLRDFERWEDEQYLWEQNRPICCECGEHITDEVMWEFEGKNYCERCVNDHKQYIID